MFVIIYLVSGRKYLNRIVTFAWIGGSSRGRRQRRGEDVVHPLKVSLEDLYLGTSKKLSLSRNVICSKCSGWVSLACFWFSFGMLVTVVNNIISYIIVNN